MCVQVALALARVLEDEIKHRSRKADIETSASVYLAQSPMGCGTNVIGTIGNNGNVSPITARMLLDNT
jgi:hypothetical protein